MLLFSKQTGLQWIKAEAAIRPESEMHCTALYLYSEEVKKAFGNRSVKAKEAEVALRCALVIRYGQELATNEEVACHVTNQLAISC